MQVSSCTAPTRLLSPCNHHLPASCHDKPNPRAGLCGMDRLFDDLHRGPDHRLPPHLKHTLDRWQVQEASRPRPSDSPPAAEHRNTYQQRYNYMEQQRTMAAEIAGQGDGAGCYKGIPTHTETLPDGSKRVTLNHPNGEVTTINIDPCNPNWTRYSHEGKNGLFTITRDGTRITDEGPRGTTTYDGLSDGKLIYSKTDPCGRTTYDTVQTDGAVWRNHGGGGQTLFPPRTPGLPYLGGR